jgi:HK97 family phage major capsid protein
MYKELNYKKDNANAFKIKFAQRKRNLRLFLMVTVFSMICLGASALDTSLLNNKGVVAAEAIGIATLLPIFMVDNKFKELKGEELNTFLKDASPEQLAEYYNAKNEASRLEIKRLIDESAEKNLATIKEMQENLAQDRIDQMKSLNEILKQHGLMIKKLSESEKLERNLTLKDSVRKGLQDNIEKLKALKNGELHDIKGNEFSFSTKAVGDMTIAGNVSGGNVPVEQRITGLNVIASRRIRLMDLFAAGTATSDLISWVYQANKDGAAGGTAEGATKNQIDYDLVVASQAVVKRTAFIKVSTEMLDDIDFINSEINNELMRELMKDIEGTAYSGNGTAPNLNGIRTVATAFAAGTFATGSANEVDNPNEIDVLVVAMNQIALAEQEIPTAILLNPTTIASLKTRKVSSTDKRYIERLTEVAGQLSLDGVPLIPTTLVTVGTYLVGAFDMATLFTKAGIRISIGLDGNDFTKNMRTIIAEWRGALVTKTNDRTAFVKGTFATDIAAIKKA